MQCAQLCVTLRCRRGRRPLRAGGYLGSVTAKGAEEMAKFQTTLRGQVIACVENAYDFVDDNGERRAGVTRIVYLSQGFGAAPLALRADAKDPAAVVTFDGLRELGELAWCEVGVEASPDSNRGLRFKLLSGNALSGATA